MISFRDLTAGLHSLNLDPGWPLIVHASLSALGEVRGGAETVLGALLTTSQAVMMPAFTYATMITPESGPPANAIQYGAYRHQNSQAAFFKMDLPADPSMGAVAEKLRQSSNAQRSRHPILSFTGVNVSQALAAQSLQEPLAPIGVLAQQRGWVVLLGVNHTTNTSIHFAEKCAGRKSFTRWALTYEGVRECPGWPGCSNGFDLAGLHLEPLIRKAQIGSALVQAIPLQAMINILVDLLRADPLALLCSQTHCERCSTIRAHALNLHPL